MLVVAFLSLILLLQLANCSQILSPGSGPYDYQRYSRQLLVYGESSQANIANAHILVLGSNDAKFEVLKHLALSGVGRISVFAARQSKNGDATKIIKDFIYGLNKSIKVKIIDELPKGSLDQFTSVVCCADLDTMKSYDDLCFKSRIPFIGAGVQGYYGFLFNNFHDNFDIYDVDGEEPHDFPIVKASAGNGSNLLNITIGNEEASDWSEGDVYGIVDAAAGQVAAATVTIHQVIDRSTVSVRCAEGLEGFVGQLCSSGRNYLRKIKRTEQIKHQQLLHQLIKPSFADSNSCLSRKVNRGRNLALLAAFQTMDLLRKQFALDKDHIPADVVERLLQQELKLLGVPDMHREIRDGGVVGRSLVAPLLQHIPHTIGRSCPATASVIGAMAVQEVVKAVTHKYRPISQFYMFESMDSACLEEQEPGEAKSSAQTPPPPPSSAPPPLKSESVPELKPIYTLEKEASSWSLGGLKSLFNSGLSPGKMQEQVTRGLVYGGPQLEELRSLRVFVVGAGAIGCEMVNLLAALEVGNMQEEPARRPKRRFGGLSKWIRMAKKSLLPADRQHEEKPAPPPPSPRNAPAQDLWTAHGLEEGGVLVTDMDLIEKSNLHRQFLFRDAHIGQAKALVAAEEARKRHPLAKVVGLTHRVGPQTESIFNGEFWNGVDVVIGALDNLEARRYLDEQCTRYGKVFIDSGMVGTKGNVQVILPHVTENYRSSADPAETAIPLCTLKTFPYQKEHCVAWAKELFQQLFERDLGLLAEYYAILPKSEESATELERWLDTLSQEELDALALLVDSFPLSAESIANWAKLTFQRQFVESVLDLQRQHPSNELDEDGNSFWAGTRRYPSLDGMTRQKMLEFVGSAGMLLSKALGWSVNETAWKQALAEVQLTPADAVELQLQYRSDNSTATKSHLLRYANFDFPDVSAMFDLEQSQLRALQFDKDDLSQGHVEFVQLSANLRSLVYALPQATTLDVQKIAGSIIPAISTTTAVVAGLATLELLKVAWDRVADRQEQQNEMLTKQLFARKARMLLDALQKFLPTRAAISPGRPLLTVQEREARVARYRNTFLNLASPMVSHVQPALAEEFSVTATGGKERRCTVWDFVDVPETIAYWNMGRLIRYLEKSFAVTVQSVTYEDYQLFLRDAGSGEFNNMKDSVRDLIEEALEAEEGGPKEEGACKLHWQGKDFIELEVLCTKCNGDDAEGEEEEEEELDALLPPVRIRVKEPRKKLLQFNIKNRLKALFYKLF